MLLKCCKKRPGNKYNRLNKLTKCDLEYKLQREDDLCRYRSVIASQWLAHGSLAHGDWLNTGTRASHVMRCAARDTN